MSLLLEDPCVAAGRVSEPETQRAEYKQKLFNSKQQGPISFRPWLLIVLIVLCLTGIALWVYEFFTSPSSVARVDQLPVVEVISIPASAPAVYDEPEVFIPAVTKVQAKIVPKAELKTVLKRPVKKVRIVRSTQRDDLLKNLQRGFTEYQQGNYVASRTAYQRALQQDENNRDALLGLAANSMREGQSNAVYLQQAEQLYWQLLELDPRDVAARGGLAMLDREYAQQSSVVSLQEAIQQRPQMAVLHYSLANKYARQRDWNQAQASYFKAFSLVPDNADYAFNLAVSLDRLGQFNTALQYYQQALGLAARGPHAINLSALHKRMQYLQEGALVWPRE